MKKIPHSSRAREKKVAQVPRYRDKPKSSWGSDWWCLQKYIGHTKRCAQECDQIGNYRKSGIQLCVITVPFTTECRVQWECWCVFLMLHTSQWGLGESEWVGLQPEGLCVHDEPQSKYVPDWGGNGYAVRACLFACLFACLLSHVSVPIWREEVRTCICEPNTRFSFSTGNMHHT